jgi:uncharacterized protein (TIGR02231 family)
MAFFTFYVYPENTCMTVQRITIITMALFCHSSLFAQSPQKLSIDAATVFLSGAELSSSARVALVKGENEILFSNVAGNVNNASLIINATNGVVVESATFQNNYLAAEVLSPRAKELKDSIEIVNDTRATINTRIMVLNEQIAVLQGNRTVGGHNTGLSVAELGKMLDLISTRMETILNQKNKQDELLKKTDERLAKLKLQQEEEQRRDYQPGGQLMVKFYSKETTTSAVNISYVVPSAGWTPIYDIMADDANGPVKLFYKANIYQNSGVKWNNVHLTISTGNPVEGAQAPVMNPWYLSFYVPPVYQQNNALPQAVYQSKRGKDVSIGGARTDGSLYAIDGVQAGQATLNEYTSVDNSGVNTTFDIDLAYTVPSDGKQHLVAVKKYEVPASYRYYAVPKLDKDAFLQANIANWEDLNLLPGQTNIFYEGAYVGQGYLDVRNVKDTMTISLGRDKKVVVKRERDLKYRSTKTIGSNVRESFAYSITVRNTRKESINLVVQDQLPVSNDKDIVIEDVETGGAEREEATGMLRWTASMAPGETKKLNFGYTIKYPKGKNISGLR